MDVEIIKKNGKVYNLGDFGITVRDFLVSSIQLDSAYGRVDGRNGKLDFGAELSERSISVPIFLRTSYMSSFPLIRDELFEVLTDTNSFYIREKRRVEESLYGFSQPNDGSVLDLKSGINHVNGKRYLVRLKDTFSIDQVEKTGESTLVFETTELPFAESVGTTQDIQRDGISATSGIWGYGMGLIAEDGSLQYTHTGSSFSIYNAGNVDVHPFESYLKIIIDQVTGSTTNFTLTNQTTGDVFKVNEAVNSLSEIVLDGANITINAAAALRKTNRQYISLAPGYNQFKITGATSARVRFDFRFLYK